MCSWLPSEGSRVRFSWASLNFLRLCTCVQGSLWLPNGVGLCCASVSPPSSWLPCLWASSGVSLLPVGFPTPPSAHRGPLPALPPAEWSLSGIPGVLCGWRAEAEGGPSAAPRAFPLRGVTDSAASPGVQWTEGAVRRPTRPRLPGPSWSPTPWRPRAFPVLLSLSSGWTSDDWKEFRVVSVPLGLNVG